MYVKVIVSNISEFNNLKQVDMFYIILQLSMYLTHMS